MPSDKISSGLRALDQARAECGHQVDDVLTVGSVQQWVVTARTDEAHARRAGYRFADRREVTVVVSRRNALGDYVVFSYQLSDRDPAVAVQSWKLDEPRLIEDWLADPDQF
jgi:hypothetical protein